MCGGVLQCAAVSCTVLQCVVLQRGAVWCRSAVVIHGFFLCLCLCLCLFLCLCLCRESRQFFDFFGQESTPEAKGRKGSEGRGLGLADRLEIEKKSSLASRGLRGCGGKGNGLGGTLMHIFGAAAQHLTSFQPRYDETILVSAFHFPTQGPWVGSRVKNSIFLGRECHCVHPCSYFCFCVVFYYCWWICRRCYDPVDI